MGKQSKDDTPTILFWHPRRRINIEKVIDRTYLKSSKMSTHSRSSGKLKVLVGSKEQF